MGKEIRVARVLDSMGYKIVLNVGSSNGINIGDKFLLYEIDPNPIIDPETGENLGNLEVAKGKGKVISVQDNVCILESINVKLRKKPVAIIGSVDNSGYYEDMPFDNPKLGDYAKKLN